MNAKPITPRFSVSAQLSPADLNTARDLGFRFIINARPDDEETGQPSTASMQDAAAKAGLGFASVPVHPGQITDEDVLRFAAAVKAADGPVLGYCRTGSRAATLWALTAAEALEPEKILSSAAAAGHDLGSLHSRLTQRHAASGTEAPTAQRSE